MSLGPLDLQLPRRAIRWGRLSEGPGSEPQVQNQANCRAGAWPARGIEIVRLMPETVSGEPQYRIKNVTTATERVVREAEIRPL